MKKSREELNKHLEQMIVKYVSDYDIQAKLMEECYKRYDYPFFRTQTILKMEASSAELSDIEIFYVLDCLQAINKYAKIKLEDYFTDIEIREYSKIKYRSNKVNFPLKISMKQVNDNQWIGTISAQELVKWRGSILKYNKNIQRRLTTVIRGNQSYEKVTLNISAVNSMVELFKNNKFIPNAITLNIDADTTQFYYDKDKELLVIEETDRLDITDGYHRLVALSKVIEEDPGFDYTMELRITCFSEEVASQFIWQEEQKTSLPKKMVKSYNMDDVANKITKRINESSSCNLSGNIMRGGLVEFSIFSEMIDHCFIKLLSDKDKATAIATLPKDIIACINAITESEPQLITKKFKSIEVYALVYTCKAFFGKDKSGAYDMFTKLSKANYSNEEKKIFAFSRDKDIIKIFDKIIEGN